jgi:putative addiction module component (TIGR02574 family)
MSTESTDRQVLRSQTDLRQVGQRPDRSVESGAWLFSYMDPRAPAAARSVTARHASRHHRDIRRRSSVELPPPSRYDCLKSCHHLHACLDDRRCRDHPWCGRNQPRAIRRLRTADADAKLNVMSTDELLAEALRLTRVDRARVAEELLSSLEESDEDVATAWATELERRSRDVAEGRVQTTSWDTARTEILKELEQRRAPRPTS